MEPLLHGPNNSVALRLSLGRAWPLGSNIYGYPRQTLSAPDRMTHQYPAPPQLAAPASPQPVIEEEPRSQYPHSIVPGTGYCCRGPPGLQMDHTALIGSIPPGATLSGVDVYESLRFAAAAQPIAACQSVPGHSQLAHHHKPPQFQATRFVSHCIGSQGLQLLRPDRNSSLTGRSGAHPIPSNSSVLQAEPQKLVPSDHSVSKPHTREPKYRDPADSDALDSEDEVISDEDETMANVALADYSAATFEPFPQTAPINSTSGIWAVVPATYYLRSPCHTMPLASDPSLRYTCSAPLTELIRPCPLIYSPGPLLDDGDASSVSHSASQIPPRPSLSSGSESADLVELPSRTEIRFPVQMNNASNPDRTAADCSQN
ncbi:hypothetical protein FGIG_07024 [Fasciola gigantica]|uniref:Uncharacterized protein n=1 Tax=Fasciola gigantica TaxID=46835 RepID=A0A504YML6_FASGI|nr:hypothetical protein FGIG_07024 [Fasciola gigantica]